jgi:hypothetical protein
MKNKIIVLILFCVGTSFTNHAQLLKKLKDKAQKVLEPSTQTETSTSSSNKQSNNDQPGESGDKTKVKWVPSPEDQKLFTLDKGEKFLYDETKVTAYNGKLKYAFVTVNSKYEYFLIEDGNRSGPFKEAPVKQMNIISDKRNEEENSGSDDTDDGKIELGGDNRDKVAQQYSKTINNKLYIVFNGKNFGPYDYVAKMKVSSDKKKFWAAVIVGGQTDMMAKMGMGNSFLVNESGVKQKSSEENGMALKMMVSEHFAAAALSIIENAKEQKAYIISSSGKKMEGNMTDMFSNDKAITIIAENGDIISVPSQSPTQLLVNGNEVAAFKVPVIATRRLFIMTDYKKSVYYTKGKLFYGDGREESLTGVMFPKMASVNNQPAIYYYKIHATDNGDKDVYLCKKVL